MAVAAIATLSYMTMRKYEVPHYSPRKMTGGALTLGQVPLSIYMTWNSRQVPYYMKQHIQNIQTINPEFDLYVYSHAECREFIQKNYPSEVVDAYDSLIPGAFRSDLFRYCKLYKDGGVYMDIKFITHIKLIDMIKTQPIHIIRDDQKEVPGCLCNGFLISPPKNPLFKKCIDTILKNCKSRAYNRNALDITGPCVLGAAVKDLMPDLPLLYNFSWATREVYDASGKKVLTEYPEYRTEQKRHMKAIDYREAWTERNVYREVLR